MLFMAWSPVRRTNAGRFEVDHPGDYATFNSYHPTDATDAPQCPLSLHKRRSNVFGSAYSFVATGKEMTLTVGFRGADPAPAHVPIHRGGVAFPRRTASTFDRAG